MQRIIDGLLYDTKTATLLFKEEDTKRQLFITPNNNYFMLYGTGEIVVKTENNVKDYLGTHSVEKYIELFGAPQEA